MKLFTIVFSVILVCALSGCQDLPDGDPPEGQIVNIDFGSDHLTQDRAVEAMIARLSVAMGKNGINNTILFIKYGDDQDCLKMTEQVMNSVAPMFGLSIIQSAKAGPEFNLVSSLKKDGKTGLWYIVCTRDGKTVFKTGVKVILSNNHRRTVGGTEKP